MVEAEEATTTKKENDIHVAGGSGGGSDEKPSCCPRDSLGPALRLHEQKPQGTMITIDPPDGLVGMESMNCYVTGEPLVGSSSPGTTTTTTTKTKRIVVVFTDVFGLEAGHHKVFADLLAERLAEQVLVEEEDDKAVNESTTEKTKQSFESVPTTVIVPDMFRGSPILQPFLKNENFSKTKDFFGTLMGSPGMLYRMKTHFPPDKVEADIFHLILPYLYNQLNLSEADTKRKTTEQPELPKLACVGFCFGGWVVGRVLGYRQRQSLRFQCGVGIHPSFQPNILHGETPTSMAERIHRPILLLPAWNDADMKPGTKIIRAIETNAHVWLKKKKKLTQSEKTSSATSAVISGSKDGDNNSKSILNNPYESASTTSRINTDDDDDIDASVSIEFPTMIHGWAVRGDPTDPDIAAEQERALQLTVQFIRKHTATDDQASVLLEQRLHENAE